MPVEISVGLMHMLSDQMAQQVRIFLMILKFHKLTNCLRPIIRLIMSYIQSSSDTFPRTWRVSDSRISFENS